MTQRDLFSGNPDEPDEPILPPWCRSAPDTSREAAYSMASSFSRVAEDVRRYIASRGPSGATADEIEQALELRHQTASARVWELAGKNRKDMRPAAIVESGERRMTRSGRPAAVWVCVEHAAKSA